MISLEQTIQSIAIESGLSVNDVRWIATNASSKYKHYPIRKKTGGWREISQPSKELKKLQRAFINCYLKNLPVHDCATAYRSGLSTRDNASPHAGHRPIVKFDFKDFFPSIRSEDWRAYSERNGIFDPLALRFTTELVFCRKPNSSVYRLTIGAPSSPMLSNVLMHDFDNYVQSNIVDTPISYTRYADDITFSAPRTGFLTKTKSIVQSAIRDTDCPSIKLNHSKTTHVTTKYSRKVTGLILGNDGSVSIGIKRYRLLRSQVHHALKNRFDIDELENLSGFLCYVNSVDRKTMDKLNDHYGKDAINKLMTLKPRRKWRQQ